MSRRAQGVSLSAVRSQGAYSDPERPSDRCADPPVSFLLPALEGDVRELSAKGECDVTFDLDRLQGRRAGTQYGTPRKRDRHRQLIPPDMMTTVAQSELVP